MNLAPALLDDFLAFAAAFGLVLYPGRPKRSAGPAGAKAGRFVHRLAAISVPRGNGKSYAGAGVGLWRLLCGRPPQDVISVALDFEGARVVLDHARTIIRGHPALGEAIEVQS